MQRLAVGPERRQPGREAQGGQEVEQVEHEPRLEMAGEGVLHDDDAARPLRRRQGSQSLRRGSLDAARGELAVEAEARSRGRATSPSLRQEPARRAADRKVVEGRQSCRHGQEMLDRGDQSISFAGRR